MFLIIPIKMYHRYNGDPIDNISYIYVNLDSLSEYNNDEGSNFSGDNVFDVFYNDQKRITIN